MRILVNVRCNEKHAQLPEGRRNMLAGFPCFVIIEEGKIIQDPLSFFVENKVLPPFRKHLKKINVEKKSKESKREK